MNCQRSHDEEMLTRELRALVEEMNQLDAPDAVEIKLRQAFRARKVVSRVSFKRSNSQYWLAAVAAILLIAISAVVLRWRSETATPPQRLAETPSRIEPKEAINPTPAWQPSKATEYQAVNDVPKRNERRPVRHPRTRTSENAAVANHVTEIATDFIPLRYMNAANLQDGGQIVRVELPRSALVKFGLPVNMERYNEKVKADVLFGVDGLAQAIRFVQ